MYFVPRPKFLVASSTPYSVIINVISLCSQLPSLVDSSSHFSGVALLVLYNSQIWSLWDIRDSFSANFTVTPEK